MILSMLLKLFGVNYKPLNVPDDLDASVHPLPSGALSRARARWGSADLYVSLPGGRSRLAD